MKIFLLALLLILVSCNNQSNSLPESVKVADGIWMYEDEDATCYQLYQNSISCTAKPANPTLKKQLTTEAVKVADGIWKSENKNHICYQLYQNSIDCIPNLKQD